MVEIERVKGEGPLLKILHLHLEVGEQSEANQFVHPARHEVSVVTFLPCRIQFPDHIRLYDGDGTFRGFWKALRAAEAGAPYDVVHAHGPIDGMLYLLFSHWLGHRLGRTVYTAHHSFTNINFKNRNRLLSFPVFRFYEKVVCVGRASLESFPELYTRQAKGRLSAVPNGVNLQRLDAALAEDPTSEERTGFTVASVGRLIEIKNPFTILEAFRGVEGDDVRLLFAGNGALEDPLRAKATETEPRATLLGEVPREGVYRLLDRQADLFVSASRGEGMPMAPLEAMATGCPVVLSNIAPHQEIADGTDIIPLLDPDDVDGFRREIQRFRDMSTEERQAIGAQCRDIVERRFSLEGMHRGYDRVYYDLLGIETPVADGSQVNDVKSPAGVLQ